MSNDAPVEMIEITRPALDALVRAAKSARDMIDVSTIRASYDRRWGETKQNLQTSIETVVEEIEASEETHPNDQWENASQHGDIMLIEEYRNAVRTGCITDYDGDGRAYDKEREYLGAFDGGDLLEGHPTVHEVIWYNR